jgi:hypothetical protein
MEIVDDIMGQEHVNEQRRRSERLSELQEQQAMDEIAADGQQEDIASGRSRRQTTITQFVGGRSGGAARAPAAAASASAEVRSKESPHTQLDIEVR